MPGARPLQRILAPSPAHCLGSQRVVLEKISSSPHTVLRATPLKIAFSTCPLISGLGGVSPGQAQGMGDNISQALRVPGHRGSLPKPGTKREGKGKEWRGQSSRREQSARASFRAPAGPAQSLALLKPPGQEENLSCEVRGPEKEGSPQNKEVIES